MSATPITMSTLAGRSLGERTARYDERDAILYALAIGARADDLPRVYERDLQVLPTYAMALGLWAVEAAGAQGAYDPTRALHVSQRLELTGPLPASGELPMQGRVTGVWDKGSAALVEVEVTSPAFRAGYGIFLPGQGGWGGERGPSAGRASFDGPPQHQGLAVTTREQAVLYRLTGDRHPIHVDPEVAAAGGFARPILHGLCTIGIAVHKLAQKVGEDPSELRRLEARMSAPVLPGDEIAVRAWDRGVGAYEFDAAVGDRVVVTGAADFGPCGEA